MFVSPDAFDEHLFRGYEGKALREVEAQLAPEYGARPRARAVRLVGTVVQDVLEKFEVLFHMIIRLELYPQRVISKRDLLI